MRADHYAGRVTTPAEARRRKANLRKAGWYAILVGIVAVAAALVALFLQVQVNYVDAPGGLFCGGIIDGFPLVGGASDACAAVLVGQALFAIVAGVIAVVAFVLGILLIARGSRAGIVKVEPLS